MLYYGLSKNKKIQNSRNSFMKLFIVINLNFPPWSEYMIRKSITVCV